VVAEAEGGADGVKRSRRRVGQPINGGDDGEVRVRILFYRGGVTPVRLDIMWGCDGPRRTDSGKEMSGRRVRLVSSEESGRRQLTPVGVTEDGVTGIEWKMIGWHVPD
jgi:hypothetical protein